MRRVGSIPQMAGEYLSAEYGHWARRPRGTAMVAWLVLGYVALTLLLDVSSNAFVDGVIAAHPQVTGTFVWTGIKHVLAPVTVTLSDGAATSRVGGAWEPLVYAVYFGGALLVGRVWRAWPAWRAKHHEEHSD